MSGTLLKADHVRVRGDRFVDSASRPESEADRQEAARARTALDIFRRRIVGLKGEKLDLQADLSTRRTEAGQRLEQARQEGHAAGLAEGRRQMEEELEEAFRLLETQEREFRAAAADYHRQADRELVRLARWMAETVLRRELPLDEEALARSVRDLLESCLDQQVLRLHLHPGDRRRLLGEDLPVRQPRLAALVQSLEGRLEWVESADVPPGACRVELHDGLLDGSPAGMLRHLEEELMRTGAVGGA